MATRTSQHVERISTRWPRLRRPVLVAGFLGWNDAGQAATAAVRWLARHLEGERIASIRPDAFHVFSEIESRPVVRHRGDERVIRWPSHDLFAIRGDKTWTSDILAFVAREPELRWRTYCDVLLSLARDLGVERLIVLGAFLAAVPHTRAVPVTGYATDPTMAATLTTIDALSTTYEGDAGAVSVLVDAAQRAGFAAASLWAAVPYYLPTTANPKAALALLRGVRDLADIPLDLTRLEDAAAFFETQVSDAVRSKSEMTEHVQELEATAEQAAAARASDWPDLPNAADVIKAFEELLRQGHDPQSGDESR